MGRAEPLEICDNACMMGSWLGGRIVAFGAAVALTGCATQQATSQALTIAGAAAVVIGASMAADEQCYAAGPGEGGVQSYCSPGLSKGGRNVSKGLAVAGVGLAAAGYALEPKGPDRLKRAPANPDAAPASPYRLIRREPVSEPEPTSETPGAPEARPSPASAEACRADGSVGSASGGGSSCVAQPEAAQPEGDGPRSIEPSSPP